MAAAKEAKCLAGKLTFFSKSQGKSLCFKCSDDDHHIAHSGSRPAVLTYLVGISTHKAKEMLISSENIFHNVNFSIDLLFFL